jgi:hypothetical protein
MKRIIKSYLIPTCLFTKEDFMISNKQEKNLIKYISKEIKKLTN